MMNEHEIVTAQLEQIDKLTEEANRYRTALQDIREAESPGDMFDIANEALEGGIMKDLARFMFIGQIVMIVGVGGISLATALFLNTNTFHAHNQILAAINDNGCNTHIDIPAPKNETNATNYNMKGFE